jgi:uncharacterized protein YjdB
MRTRKPYISPMFLAAIAFAVFACVDRGDPTSPSSDGSPSDATVAVVLPTGSLEVGRAVNAAVVATNSAGKTETPDSIEWSSSDTSILSVTSGGLVTARRMGDATIYAKWKSKFGKRGVAVTDTTPAKVTVSPSTTSQAVGAQVNLTAAVTTVTGRALPGQEVTWRSTDSRYVTVSSTGVATAVKPGNAKVIAAASDNAADTAVVTVSPAAISSLSITPGTDTVSSGHTVQLTAHAADSAGNELTGRTVGWASSDEGVATVSTSGLVTAAKIGTTTITATSEGVHATASIRVAAGGVAKITVDPGSVGLVAGKTQQLSASMKDESGNALATQGITWSSANNSIASVSTSGMVTALHTGSTTISASANGITGQASVVVSAGAVADIAVSPSSVSLTNGGTEQLSAKLTDASGNTLNQTVAWSSSNSAVAAVSSSGDVTAKQAGSATITAAAGGATGSSTITVAAGAVSSVSVSPGSSSLIAGGTQQLTAKLADASGSTVTGQTVTWSSSNSAVVSVSSSGLATAAHTGTATVTATAAGHSGSATFSVSAGPVSTITITPASGSVIQGRTLQLAASFHDAEGNAVSGGTVTWSSSNKPVAAVSTSGLVTGVAVGNASITATADGKSKSAAIAVTGSSSGTTTEPAPAPAPPPPPPPPTTTATACTQIPHSRLVSVSSSSELHSALSSAQPGDLINMADGTYGDGTEFRVSTAGTSSARITLCGTANAVINAGSISNRDGVRATGANYWTFSGFTITNALFGFYAERSTHLLLQGLTVHGIGQEGIEIAAFSKNAVISGNRIYDTGRVMAEYGEGIYIGSANAKWAALTGGQPDATDSVVIEGNHIGPDVRAEHIDAKEGTVGGIIRNNTFDGHGMIESEGTGESGWPNSWVILQGVGYHVSGNTGSTAISAGFRVVTHGTVETGTNNSFSGNNLDVNGAPYGFLIQTGSSSQGNVVRCDNSVIDASKGLANVSCQ